MNKLDQIRDWIDTGDVEKAIGELAIYLADDENTDKDVAYYLLGNVYRKQGNWQLALNNYQQAIDINPESPAVHARKMAIDILNFYNKDMYNQ